MQACFQMSTWQSVAYGIILHSYHWFSTVPVCSLFCILPRTIKGDFHAALNCANIANIGVNVNLGWAPLSALHLVLTEMAGCTLWYRWECAFPCRATSCCTRLNCMWLKLEGAYKYALSEWKVVLPVPSTILLPIQWFSFCCHCSVSLLCLFYWTPACGLTISALHQCHSSGVMLLTGSSFTRP